MPDIVNDDDLSALAAEYVLGTLEADERTRANVLLDVDHGFRGLVRVWERRLGELHLMVEPVEPDAKIWERIKGKLGAVAPSVAPPEPVPEKPVPSTPEQKPSTPEQKLAELIMEVEKFNGARAPEPPVPETDMPDPDTPAAVGAPAADLVKAEDRTPERVLREPPAALLAADDRKATTRKPARVGGWRVFALLMTLVAFGLGGLIAAWRFIPDSLPAQLRPIAFLKIPEAPGPVVKKPPPGSDFDE